LRAEGFFCSLGVLYRYIVVFDLKINKFFFSAVIFSILGYQTLDRDPDPESGSAIRKNAGSGSVSALNQCGSETLV
jgi:hypothetical protein